MNKLIPMACLALLGTAGHALALPQSSDQATTAANPKPDAGIQKVTVSGARADDT